MSSYLSEEEDYSKYSAFDEAGSSTIADSTTFVIQSKDAAGSISLADIKFDSHNVKRHKQPEEYSRDEFLYALSSPSSIGAMVWIVLSFFAVIYGSSVIVYLNFCIPMLLGPYVIKEQMPAQLLPSVRRKYESLRSEANALAAINVQLKGTVSRMQRQEYRLSASEERFEHLCKRSNKDIVKMKQLARKNVALRQKIKVNVAGKKLQELLKSVLAIDSKNIKHSISQKEIDEVVILIKDFDGKNASSRFDKNTIQSALYSAIAKKLQTKFISNQEIYFEARDSDGRHDDSKTYNPKEGGLVDKNDEETELSSYSNMDKVAKMYGRSPDDDTRGGESLTVSENYENDSSLKSDPSGRVERSRYAIKASRDVIPITNTTRSSGTMDSPIDIERILFEKNIPKQEKEHENPMYYYSEKSGLETFVLPIE